MAKRRTRWTQRARRARTALAELRRPPPVDIVATVAEQIELVVSPLAARVDALGGELERLSTATPWVPESHFYSSTPSFKELSRRWASVFEADPTDIPGVDLRLPQQLALLEELAVRYSDLPFSEEPTPGLRYYYNNDLFSYSDGILYALMLDRFAPKRVIEVGSGFSSVLALDASECFLKEPIELTLIEPYPEVLRELIKPQDLEWVELIERPLQDVPLETFDILTANDVLFIDSTHMSKAGSDVNYAFFSLLPRLKSGVLVHIHDIFAGFEYPWEWVREGRAWNESYLLRSFLQFNSAFELVLHPPLMHCLHPALMAERFPLSIRNRGGSVWLRRV